MNRNIALSALALVSACSSIGNYDVSYNMWEKPIESKRAPASFLGLNQPSNKNELQFKKQIINVCGLKFDSIEIESSDKNILVNPKWISHKDLLFKYPVPDSLTSIGDQDSSLLLRAGKINRVSITNPLLPDLPILPSERREELCMKVKNYHHKFFSVLENARSFMTQSAQFINDSRGPSLELRPIISYRSSEITKISYTDNVAYYPYDSLIIYDDKYQSEVSKIAGVHIKSGFFPKTIKLSNIPGMNANGETPEECEGDYLKECYHYWGDKLEGASNQEITSLPGFYIKKNSTSKSNRIAYIPGLIKAFIRAEKKKVDLKGVLLVGNPEIISPFHTVVSTQMPQIKLSTDLFYMLPDLKLVPSESTHQEPISRVMELRSRQGQQSSQVVDAPDFQNYQLKDVIPVGRLITRNDKNTKDSIVKEYANKIHRWQSNLPSLKGNSVLSIGGGAGDHQTVLYADLSQFQDTYGDRSKIYAPEFLVPNKQCQGKCEYKTGITFFNEQISPENKTGFIFTGHGSYFGIETPYSNGQGILKNFKDGTLVGHVLANSGSLSNYGLFSDQRSFGEQFIQVPNGGTVNTFFNSDVGWGGSDNRYDIKFMSKIKDAHNDCRPIGEALRLTIFDMIKGKTDGAGNWQLVNRQFQGSPLNNIARMPAHCMKLSQNIDKEFRIR